MYLLISLLAPQSVTLTKHCANCTVLIFEIFEKTMAMTEMMMNDDDDDNEDVVDGDDDVLTNNGL